MGRIWAKYTVSYEDYFNGLKNDLLVKINNIQDPDFLKEGRIHAFSKNFKNTKESMLQLIKKYQMQNKKILSIAPAVGSEEYWFWENGDSLTFIDIDQGNIIEPFLKSLPQKQTNFLTYHIGDAFDYNENRLNESFNICYCSSFAPEELRRKKIIEDYSRYNLKIFFAKVIRKFVKIFKIQKYIKVQNWPKNEDPLMDLIINYVDLYLDQGGLFIQQEYAFPIDFRSNPHAINLIQKQLEKIGVQLLKIYSYKERWLSNLIVGYRGTKKETLAYAETISTIPDINMFSGRSPYGREGGGILVIFDLTKNRLL